MKNKNWKYLYRIKRLEIKSWLKYLMLEGKSVIDYILGEIVTGTYITINNTVEKTFNLFNVKGNSTQETTTGKNLLPNNLTTIKTYNTLGTWSNNVYTYNGLTFTFNNDGTFKINGTSTGNSYVNLYFSTSVNLISDTSKTYTFIKGITNNNIFEAINEMINSAWTPIKYTSADSTTYTPSGNSSGQLFKILIENNKTISNVTIYPMIVEGTTVGAYEPYTYGASPNPSYEQPIYSAGDNINLFDKSAVLSNYELNGSTGATSALSGWSVSDYIEVSPNTNYYLSGKTEGNSNCFYNSSKNYISTITGKSGIIAVPNNSNIKYMRFNMYTSSINNVKLIKGSTVTPYSPYNMGTISEKIVNKNLADWEYGEINYSTGAESSSTTKIKTKQVIPLNNGDTIAYVTNLTNAVGIRLYEKDGTFISSPSFSSTTHTYTNNLGRTVYAKFRVALETGETLENAQVQIEYGDPTTYVAHQEQTYTIPCQQPMRSIGTVRDEFIQVNGEWKERHNIGKVVLNGSESYTSMGWIGGRFGARTSINNLKQTTATSQESNVKSNYYSAYSQNALYDLIVPNSGISNRANQSEVILRNDNVSSVADLKTWLSTHNTEIIYQLATPQDLPCTEEQISILENLPKSYNEQTNIYSLDVTPSFLEVQAYVKKEVIEND